MKTIPIYLFFFSVVFLTLRVSAQHERLVPLRSNAQIRQYLAGSDHAVFRSKSIDTLDLPVIDDFSSSEVYPDQSKWSDRYVFVNNQFARNPITIGVATFDGLDEFGNAYNNSSPTVQGGCDTLTSQFIRLQTKPQGGSAVYTSADSVVLSFFWQKKGWGDAPDSSDSLVVDFYNPTTNQWSRQWFLRGLIAGGQDTSFTRALIWVTNPDFLKDGFRFRFRNYGSRTGSLDHWHIDYVELYQAKPVSNLPLDTVLVDVAMTQQPLSLLNEFTSIPWDHYTSLSVNDQQNLVRDSSIMQYRVNDIQPNDVGFNNRIYNYAGSYVAGFGADNGNIFPSRPQQQFLRYSFPVDSVFPASNAFSADSTRFTVLNYFTNGNAFGGLKSNDTVRFVQEFTNYYSFDDGTAEVGYDLINAPNGKLCMKFDMLKPDTLRAVRFFFLQQGADVSNKLFTIKIWSSLSPETVLYQESAQRPAYENVINGYATYVLDQLVPVSGTVYIGFQQVLGDGLHLGFDRNTASNSRMFYNVGSGWIQTAITAGTFMIRPVMGDSLLFLGVNDLMADESAIRIFPNPATDHVNVLVDKEYAIKEMEVFAADGRLLLQCPVGVSRIDVSGLPDGAYFLSVRTTRGDLFKQRFILAR